MNVNVQIPTLHEGQQKAFDIAARFRAIRCGRRWGKTLMAIAIVCDKSVKGESWGIFAPDYKILSETYRQIEEILSPVTIQASKIEGVIRLKNGGRIDFWTLNNPHAGRSRAYDGVILDEVAFAGPDMLDIWQKAIKPTLLDRKGLALAFSTPSGKDDENFFYRICTDLSLGFKEFHAPTHTNPYLPQDEISRLESENTPQVYLQEYLAEFVDWNGVAFFQLDKMLVDGKPVAYPYQCDQIFATLDTAVKEGWENDGSAVCLWARNKIIGHPLILLDWDIVQIEGAILENWLPSIVDQLENLAKKCQAREGSKGIWIEDKSSGSILIQQGKRRRLPVHLIDSKLTAAGKEGRALSVSGYYHREMMKISEHAFNKVVSYKGQTKNHFLSQFCGFRMGQNKANSADDLLDAGTYGIAIALGNAQGY